VWRQKKTSIFLIIGTRPQIIKSAPIIHEGLKQGLDLKIVHTGQHYDYGLSQVFFEELSPPEPLTNLGVGSGSHVFQTAEIMLRLEKCLVNEKPSLVLIPGDTNSALAGALTSVKLGIPVAHVEAGARCYDMKMAEEINRRLIDHCSETLFVPTPKCRKNLENESVPGRIYETGDTMYDMFLQFKDKADRSDILSKLDLSPKEYVLLTLHRAENVDDTTKLKAVLKAIEESKAATVFPIHPRTKNRLQELNASLEGGSIRPIEPVGYIEMLKLLKHARMVLTDSGGLQKEVFWSRTPCITLRDRTEWTETVEMGVNQVAGADPQRIIRAIRTVDEEYAEIKSRFKNNPFGDGKASERIVEFLKRKSTTPDS
jgi:UDP-N-acetylglucosamine 2-epimerase